MISLIKCVLQSQNYNGRKNEETYIASHETPNKFEYFTPHGLIACCWDVKVLSFERDSWIKAVLDNPKGSPNIQEYLQLRFNEDV